MNMERIDVIVTAACLIAGYTLVILMATGTV